MVVSDGFFIVQLLRKKFPINDLSRQQYNDIMYDLLLLKNQLPFFVLVKLYEKMIQNDNSLTQDEPPKTFTEIALGFYKPVIGYETDGYPDNEVPHLLSLIYDVKTWPLIRNVVNVRSSNDIDGIFKNRKNVYNERTDQTCSTNFKSIRCATELENAGIAFERRDAEREHCVALDIEFKIHCRKSKLRIPTLVVDDNTERMFRNLIAFEQILLPWHPTYIFDYVKFLDLLINSGKDVKLLCYSGIIENMLGRDYKAVADIFNRLCVNAHGSAPFYYSNVFEQVDRHCHSRCNQQMAYLRRNYFNSAWALLSFLAALLLLLLTLAQTIYALLSSDCAHCWLVVTVPAVLLIVIGLVCCLLFR